MDYGVGPERVRYMQRLYRFYGMQIALVFLLVPAFCLLVRHPILEAVPGILALSRILAGFFPVIAIVAPHYPNPKAISVAIALNISMAMMLSAIVIILRWRALRSEGYSDLGVMLYSRFARYTQRNKNPLSSASLTYRGSNYLGVPVLFLSIPTLIAGWWPINSSANFGIFDGHIFLPSYGYRHDGPFAVMARAIYSHISLFWLMVGQEVFVYIALVGLLYTITWPMRRAAHRNDQAYLQARVASGLDDPAPKARQSR